MIPENLKSWYYFGCRQRSGHYLFDARGKSPFLPDLTFLDGLLCPPDKTLYRGLVTRIPKLGYTSLAWWDQTVDKRPGSNSIIFSPSLTCSISTIERGLDMYFGWVRKRLPEPLIISDDIRTWISHK